MAKRTFSITMWNNLPFDILSNIFSFLTPDSLASAKSACTSWRKCARTHLTSISPAVARLQPPWFLALPARNCTSEPSCFIHNPIANDWYVLPLDFLSDPVKLIAAIGGLVLLRPTSSTILQLDICNPFTRQHKQLPMLNTFRTNPAIGVVMSSQSRDPQFPSFRVYVAGGMSNSPRAGATYESTIEFYDSLDDKWQVLGPMPVEFAVRLTVWTPNESVYSNGVLYWMTSARAYSIMGYEINTNEWHELNVPLADRLEFAALVRRRNGNLTLVGGTGDRGVCIWELTKGAGWVLVEKVGGELVTRLPVDERSWSSTKCVGGHGVVCLYRDLWSGMLVWREIEDKGTWEWCWIEGCCSIRGKQVQNFPLRAVLLHPDLAPSRLLME